MGVVLVMMIQMGVVAETRWKDMRVGLFEMRMVKWKVEVMSL